MNQKSNKTTWIILSIFTLFLASCAEDKDYYDPTSHTDNPLEDVVVPNGFDWSLTRSIKLNATVNDEFDGKYYYLVEAFDKNPLIDKNAVPLTKGVAKKGETFSSFITLNKNQEYIYIKQTDPKGRITYKALATSEIINYNFNATSAPLSRSGATRADYSFPNYTSIPSDATEVTGSSNNDHLDPGKNYKITKDYNGGIYHTYNSGNPATLYVNANWTPPVTGTNWKSIFDSGILIVIMPEGKIETEAKVEFNGKANIHIMSGGILKAKELLFTNENEIYNSGYIDVTNNLTLQSKTKMVNICSIKIGGELSCSSANATVILDHGYMVANTIHFTNTTVNLDNGSMLEAKVSMRNTSGNTYINNGESHTLVKSPTMMYGWGGAKYTGNMGIEYTNVKDESGGNFDAWALENFFNYADTRDSGVTEYAYEESDILIVTGCGDTINGGNEGGDPNDPEFPIINTDGKTYTYLFEDQWPLYGDYDMNDVVIDIKDITYSSNKENKVGKLEFDFTLKAIGAGKVIAVATSLEKASSNSVKSVSYNGKTPSAFDVSNGVETGQQTAVIPLIDDVHAFLGLNQIRFINTESVDMTNLPTVTVTIEFSDPVDLANLSIDDFNLFIITDLNSGPINSTNRKEIHVYGYAPTLRANTSYFGNHNDASDKYSYYASKDNLAWGIRIPAEFKWPLEYVNITEAYTSFTTWITSGGTAAQDWYTNPVASKVISLN